jgi:hypothetical protein
MKATTIIIAAVFSIQISTLFAANEFPPVTSNNAVSASYYVSLVPSTPVEASFEDFTTTEKINLIPTTPVEATFVETPSEMVDLAPVTPAVAEFDDDVIAVDNGILAPVTPTFADFE